MSEPAISKSKARRNRKNKAAGAAAAAGAGTTADSQSKQAEVANGNSKQPEPAIPAAGHIIAKPTSVKPVVVVQKLNTSLTPPPTTVGSGGSSSNSSGGAAGADTKVAPTTLVPIASASGGGSGGSAGDTKSAPPAPGSGGKSAGNNSSSGDGLAGLNLKPKIILTPEQIQHFRDNGYLVVPRVLTPSELATTRQSYHDTLKSAYGVDHKNLSETARSLKPIHIAGGILEIFYPGWKLDVCACEALYGVMSQLYAATYASGTTEGFEHSYGPFDPNHLMMYIDRTNYRVPTVLSNSLGNGKRPLQSGLQPHVDCNPYELYNWWTKDPDTGRSKSRWRPIQSFVTLTEIKGANQGGFEFIPRFHKEFTEFFAAQPSNMVARQAPHREHFQLHPQTFPKIHERLKKDLRVEAGSVVMWDWRIVHCNAAINDSKQPREVVYTGFLPDIKLNRQYVAEQLRRYHTLQGVIPFDFRNVETRGGGGDAEADSDRDKTFDPKYQFSELGQRMIGLKMWDGTAIPVAAPDKEAVAAAATLSKSGGDQKSAKPDGNSEGGSGGSGSGSGGGKTSNSSKSGKPSGGSGGGKNQKGGNKSKK